MQVGKLNAGREVKFVLIQKRYTLLKQFLGSLTKTKRILDVVRQSWLVKWIDCVLEASQKPTTEKECLFCTVTVSCKFALHRD